MEENAEELYRRFRPGVRSFFQRKGFSPQESEELTQDVFLRVFKGIASFRREARFERWLWEIRAHIYSNEVRRRRTEKRDAWEQSLSAAAETEDGEGSALDPPTTEPSPEENVVQSEQSKALRAALKSLPDQMRRCCILRYEKGYKYQEIATIMRISIETVKAHLHQARKRLTALLGDEPEKETDS